MGVEIAAGDGKKCVKGVGTEKKNEERERSTRLEQSTAKRAVLTRLAAALMEKRDARGQTSNVFGMHTFCWMFGCLAGAHDQEKLRYLDAWRAPTFKPRSQGEGTDRYHIRVPMVI